MRDASGWKTDDPTPSSPAATRSRANDAANASSIRPASENPMPITREYGIGPPVRVDADERLQQRGRQHQRQCHQADLGETQGKCRLQERIYRREDRLDRVVEQMREANRGQNRERGTRLVRGSSFRTVRR